jgi:hypothetical protein
VLSGEELCTSTISATSTTSNISDWSATRDAFFMGPCPHEWLFQHVNAVVHHGGAGEYKNIILLFVF